MTCVRHLTALTMAAGLGLMVAPVFAGDSFEPTPTFVMETRTALGIEPQDVALGNGFAYVLGVNADGASTIDVHDAATLAMVATLSVEATIEDIEVDPQTGMIYAIGNDGSASRFQILDAKLNMIGGVSFKPRLGHPSLSTTPDGFVAVSGVRTDYSDGFFAAVDVRDPKKPFLREEFFAADARSGVLNGWLDANYGAIFLNASWDSRFSAVATGKSYVMSEFSVETSTGTLSEPYAVTAQLRNDPCRNDEPTNFLVADMTRSVLSLVEFDESFQSLDMLSLVEFNLAPSRAVLGQLAGTSMREPSGLISASCDQSAIFLGSKTSSELAQFARNKGLASLERVGTIRLPGRPSAIAVDPSSGFAIVVSADNRLIMRLSNKESEAPNERVIGNSDVRELQRTLTEIGIPVGSIDGIIGAKTQRAVSLAERKFGVQLDTQKDIKKSVETLKGIFK